MSRLLVLLIQLFDVHLLLQPLLEVHQHGLFPSAPFLLLLHVAYFLLLDSVFYVLVFHNVSRAEGRDVLLATLLLVLHEHPIVILIGLILLPFGFLQLLHPIVVVTLLFYTASSVFLSLLVSLLHELVQLLPIKLFVGTVISSRLGFWKHV